VIHKIVVGNLLCHRVKKVPAGYELPSAVLSRGQNLLPLQLKPSSTPQDRHIKIKIKGIQSFNQIVFWVTSIEYTLYSLVIFAPALVTGIVQTGTILITKSETVGKLK
jgi:hypothetical protein